MLKTEFFLIFGLIFVCVGAQNRPVRPPKPPRISGSYSDYPGLLVNKNPIQTNRQDNVQANVQNNNIVSQVLPANVQRGPSSSGVVRNISGPIVIPAASSSYISLPGQATPSQDAPSQTGSFSGLPKSAQGIPVSVVAAAELTQQYEKPRAPIKTGTDTWTPMGFTGDGKSFDIPSTARPAPVDNMPVQSAPSATPQPVPYDSTNSKQTIGQQIIERQQKQQHQQQQQQQYDIFGFPIDNSPDPFASMFGMAPSNGGGLFGPMFSSSSDPFFGSFGGALSGSNPGATGGRSQSGPAGNNMLQMMLMMQLLGGDAPDPQPRGRGRGRGRPGAPSSPLSAIEQLFRMEEMRMRRQRQQELVNRNRQRPENQRRPAQRQGPSQQNRYKPVVNTAPRIPKPTRTKSAVVLYPGSAPRRNPPRQSLHPAVLDRRDMPTTPAPLPQGQEPVEREGPAAAAPKAPITPPFRQSAIERHSIRRNYVQRGPPPPSRDYSAQYNQSPLMPYNEPPMPYNEPPMPYNEPTPAANGNFGQNFNTFQDPFLGGFQQRQQPQSPPPPPPPPSQQPNQQQSYQQQPTNNPLGAKGSRQLRNNLVPNAVPRNLQQLTNNPLFQRQLRTAGATPGANPADVRADQADLMADRADNLQSISPFERIMSMAMAGARGAPSPAGLSPLTNTLGSSAAAGNPLGMGMMARRV